MWCAYLRNEKKRVGGRGEKTQVHERIQRRREKTERGGGEEETHKIFWLFGGGGGRRKGVEVRRNNIATT